MLDVIIFGVYVSNNFVMYVDRNGYRIIVIILIVIEQSRWVIYWYRSRRSWWM